MGRLGLALKRKRHTQTMNPKPFQWKEPTHTPCSTLDNFDKDILNEKQGFHSSLYIFENCYSYCPFFSFPLTKHVQILFLRGLKLVFSAQRDVHLFWVPSPKQFFLLPAKQINVGRDSPLNRILLLNGWLLLWGRHGNLEKGWGRREIDELI